jgi:valine--pyruvate aminotransferase
MDLSQFGRRYAEDTGISGLMDDLGDALSGDRPMLMLGGGNPSHIPEVQAVVRARMEQILAEDGALESIVGDYDAPQGERHFIEALATLFRTSFGWDISPANIALTNGSQNSFFYLFNMFAGRYAGGVHKRLLLPLAPEYIGYADVGLEPDFFVANRPEIERIDEHLFKYHVDFDRLVLDDHIGAMCVSRPTNPTGNVLTDEEIASLRRMAHEAGVPLIIDNAYGMPFPDIIHAAVQPVWDRGMVLCMSLSKLGLPGVRTGIVVADEEIIRIVSRMTSVFALSPNSMGAALALELVRSGEITRLSREVVRPFYKRKADRAAAQLTEALRGIPFAMHKPEGALFLWLWFEGLPITSAELYERLKARGVLVVSGHYFFPGLEGDPWRHKDECIRVTYAQDDAVVEQGLAIIADEVRRLYA